MEISVEQELLTAKEAAELLRVSSTTIGNMIRRGKIRGTKVGIGGRSSPWRVYKEDVIKYLELRNKENKI